MQQLRVLVWLAVCAILIPAQTPPDFRASTNLAQIDVVVTDNRGNIVTGLTASDFELLEDGKPRPVANFGYIELPPPPASDRPLQKSDVRRSIAIVVDDARISWNDLVLVRDAVRKFVEKELQPGDLVSLSFTGADSGSLSQFTANKRILNTALERIRWSGLGFEDIRDTDGERARSYLQFSMLTLQTAIQSLQDMPGRKSAIFFGLGLDPQNMSRVLDGVTAAANRAGVTVYTIDPSFSALISRTFGPGEVGVGQGANSKSASTVAADQSNPTPDFGTGNLKGTAQGARLYLTRMAQDTGGLFFASTSDPGASLRKAIADQGSYYLLGYTVPDEAITKSPKLDVRIKQPGLQVRARKSFIAPPVAPDRNPANVLDTLHRALMSPFSATGVRARLKPIFSATDENLHALIFVDGRDLQFERTADGMYRGDVEFLVATYDSEGVASGETKKGLRLNLTADGWRQMSQFGLSHVIVHPVKKPGLYQVRVAVRDGISGDLGSASHSIDVPDLKKKRMSLSGIVLRAPVPETLPLLFRVEETPDSREPKPSSGPAAHPLSNPAARGFVSGEGMEWIAEVLHPAGDSKAKPDLRISARILRDGEVVSERQFASTSMQPLGNTVHLVGRGTFPIDPGLPQGDYVLELRVQNSVGEAKNSTASESIDFQVIAR